MQNILIALLAIYGFVLLGWLSKRIFKERVNEETLTIMSVYFFQPILNFWGLLTRPINHHFFTVGGIYLAVILTVMIFTAFLAQFLFKNKPKERSIFTVAGIGANTGNLGITAGLVLLGPESVPYTTMINVANAFFFFTLSAFYYSRGSFSFVESLKNVVKLPLLWAALAAIILNSLGYTLSGDLERIFQMGAYTSIVISLIVFGAYLSSVHLRKLHPGFISGISVIKYLAVPAVGILFLIWLPMPGIVAGAIFLQLLTPLAINNINLAALFKCKPTLVTELVFITSLIFIGVLPIGAFVIQSGLLF